MVAKRIEYLDSLKFILIVLVVFGHVMEHDLYPSQLRRSIYSFIYCFHMPLFVIISGYFSRNTYNFNKLAKTLFRFFLSYFIFQILLYTPDFIRNQDFSLYNIIFLPYKSMWYLAGLIWWRLFIFFIQKIKIPPFIIIQLSFLFAFICFYVDQISFFINMRIIAFFPFFLIGYYMKDTFIENLKQLKVLYSLLILIIIFLLIYFFSGIDFLMFLFFNFPSYSHKYDYKILAFFYQISAYLLSILTSIYIFNLCANLPSKIENFFAKYGSKTYTIYLLHSVLIYSIYFPLFNISKGTPDIFDKYISRDVLITLLLITISLFLDKFKIIQYIVDPYSLIDRKSKAKKNIQS